VYTLAIALSDADSFSGGEFFIKDQIMKDNPTSQDILDAPQHVITPSKLGGTLFRSHLVHGVNPVTEGYRKMFVIEYWKRADGKVGEKRRNPEFFQDVLGMYIYILINENVQWYRCYRHGVTYIIFR
jgi:predicted 2-oxoglutarate/Fe(II)-dependent dioxygenase YbiX